jgi:hypothetical protein
LNLDDTLNVLEWHHEDLSVVVTDADSVLRHFFDHPQAVAGERMGCAEPDPIANFNVCRVFAGAFSVHWTTPPEVSATTTA